MKKTYTIGRDPSCCNIVIYDLTDVVSRSHATLRVDGRRYYITDHSTNGTYLNGIRLTPNMEYKVTPDDDISFGNVASFDWSAITKSKSAPSWWLFVISIAAIAILAALAIIFIPRLKKQEIPETDYGPEKIWNKPDSLKTIPNQAETVKTILPDINPKSSNKAGAASKSDKAKASSKKGSAEKTSTEGKEISKKGASSLHDYTNKSMQKNPNSTNEDNSSAHDMI